MTLIEMIQNHYPISQITSLEKTTYGSGKTYTLKTEQLTYLFKFEVHITDVVLYSKVLESVDLKLPKIYLTNDQSLCTKELGVLYEFIEGETYEIFKGDMIKKAIIMLKDFNEKIRPIQVSYDDFETKNDWDLIRHLSYLISDVPKRIENSPLNDTDKSVIKDSIDVLKENHLILEGLEKQLIHTDLGADNFMVQNKQIVSIIDFTPDYDHEWYALAHFVYWNYLWAVDVRDEPEINRYLEMYETQKVTEDQVTIFRLMMMRVALYRVVGPLFEMERSENADYTKLFKRVEILKWFNTLVVEHSSG